MQSAGITPVGVNPGAQAFVLALMTAVHTSKSVERTLGKCTSFVDTQNPSEEITTSSQTTVSLISQLYQPVYSANDAPGGLNLTSQVPMVGMKVPPIGKFTGNTDVETFNE